MYFSRNLYDEKGEMLPGIQASLDDIIQSWNSIERGRHTSHEESLIATRRQAEDARKLRQKEKQLSDAMTLIQEYEKMYGGLGSSSG